MSERNLDKLPIPTTIISEKEIRLINASKLYDAIKIQTGIMSMPTKTGTEGLQMQGLDASYITILIDGFPIIGRSFGALDLKKGYSFYNKDMFLNKIEVSNGILAEDCSLILKEFFKLKRKK